MVWHIVTKAQKMRQKRQRVRDTEKWHDTEHCSNMADNIASDLMALRAEALLRKKNRPCSEWKTKSHDTTTSF